MKRTILSTIPKLLLLAVIFVGLGASTKLSAQDSGGFYEEEVPSGDSSQSDEYYDPNFEGDEYNPDGTLKEDAPKKPEKKPYVRIVMPYDTISELITYTEIIEQPDSYVDSLYLRAKKYLERYGKLKQKDFTEDLLYEKIVTDVTVPLVIRVNKYSKVRNGDLKFKLTIRFKDGRYKYDVNNLVHLLPPSNLGKKTQQYVYCEYYMTSTRNIIGSDQILRAADFQVQKIIGEIKKALKEPVLVDEDDW